MVRGVINLKKHRYYWAIIGWLFLFTSTAKGQYCEWLRSDGGLKVEQVWDIEADVDNDVVIVGNYGDSFSVDNMPLPAAPAGGYSGFLIKYDTYGSVIWARGVNYPNTGFLRSAFFEVAIDKNKDIYVVGEITGTVDFGNGVVTSGASTPVLVKYSSNGVAQWVRSLGGNTKVATTQQVCIDNNNNVIWGFDFQNTMTFSGTTTSLTANGGYDLGFLKYDANGNFITAANFGSVKDDVLGELGTDGDNNIYIVGGADTTMAFGIQFLLGKGEVILKTDSAFNPIIARKTDLKTPDLPYSYWLMAVQENGKFAIVSLFADTVNFGGVTLASTSPSVGSIGDKTCRIVYYDDNLNPIWGRKSEKINSNPNSLILPGGKMYIKKNNIYFGGGFALSNFRLGSTILKHPGGNRDKFFITKMDTLGNFLWSFADNDTTNTAYSSTFQGIAINEDGDAYLTGYYYNKIKIFNKSDSTSTSNGNQIYVAKISDYTITRGYVSSGPYCAGDSLRIPFTKQGEFSVGNEFIAELSDSAGNFEGGHRELGRIQDTLGGVINGQLPLFNVATTNKYRIRILSTNPIVQSYYRRDTLRLLIYSKDTANAGADQTICNGQNITLGTTGGSRWQWSPTNYFVNPADSSNRQPQVKPNKTTEFRIIISDSSGCGVTDTDYVKVFIRPELKTTIQGDSVACRGLRQTLKAVITGGDSTHYWYIWKTVGFNIINSTTSSFTIRPVVPTQYMIITGDSCSNKIDTAYFTLNVLNNLKAIATPDTSLCLGNSITLGVTGMGCNPNKYTYEWFEVGNSNVVSNNDSITVNPTTTTQYRVILKDTSTFLVDTAHVKVTVYQPLQLTVNADSTICVGQTAELRATVTGGNPNSRNILWTANNLQLSTNNTVQVSPTTTATYKALLSDGCSLQNDSAEITITVRPKLEITVNADTTICLGESTELKAVAKGGLATNHKLLWTANNQQLSTNNQLQVTPTITTTYWASLSDGCSTPNDSATITVTVRPSLKVSINADSTICVGENVLLRATPSGGFVSGYSLQWFDNNGLLSSNFNVSVSPSVSTSYKAVLSDGCTVNGDSDVVSITVRPPLSVKGTAKDSICANQILLLTATPSGGLNTNHNILWTVDNGLWTSNQNPATDTPKINTKYIVQLSDNCSPTVYDTLDIIVLPIPQADFIVAPQNGCPPLTINLQDNSTGNDTTLNSWTIGGAEYQNIASFTHQFTQTGTYSLKLTVANALGCADQRVQPNSITVYPKPQADFIVKPDIKEIEEPLTLLNRSNTNTVIWDMGDGNQLIPNPNNNGDTTYSYQDTGWLNLSLIAQNKLGCFDTAIQKILLYDKVHCIIPSAFTPNGNDNINPVFAPVCVGVATYTLTIYNRWGQIIYLQENGAWDGTYNESAVPSDMYMYKLQMQADSKKKKLTYGTVQVIR